MQTIRCPMCGKENPDELEICQFCEARLKPLARSLEDSPESEEENKIAPPAEDMPSQAAEIPDWLQELRGLEDEPQLEYDASPDEGETGADGDTSNGWNLESGAEAVDADSSVGSPQETVPPAGSIWSASQDETDASPYQAPGWPQKSGPAEVPATPPSQPSEPAERAGPLAGLRGLLAADAGIPRSRYPATRPSRLRISANQLVHIDLLREMLDDEGKPQPVPARRVISSDHLMRWGIALVLLVAVLWSVLYPGQPSSLPLYQEETAELNRLIEQLPEEAPVLVAFDYEPALSAEMDTAAYAVLDHLMLNGATLTLISTSATGPLLAERFMQRLWPVHHYLTDQQYTNLGYVPGGPAGLASLGRNLPETLPYTLNGLFAWESPEGPGAPPLAGIQTITDYPLILVLVDDADTARAWVEQLQPYLSGPTAQSSLTMVTSAQVEPIVWPYFDANPRQVHGFVSGIRGGASYARLSGREDMPRRYWNSYGMGLFMAALLILVGGLFYVTYPMLARPPKADGEAGP